MSESAGRDATGTGTAGTGRYLYCFVDVGDEDPDAAPALDVTGIEGRPVSVVVAADTGIGAVVHARERPYDSTDLTELKEWLLSHQQVVEAAGDRFGPPLPARFDTVLEGDDDGVAAWLAANAGAVEDAFDAIAGCWEYRVTLSWDPTAFEAEQRTADPELAEIDDRLERSSEGTAFLLRKQHDARLRELVRRREAELEERLVDRLAADSVRLTERPLRSDAAASLGVELDSDTVVQVAVLAPRENEPDLGAALEEAAAVPGADVRFTGPWPPYTFAPSITED